MDGRFDQPPESGGLRQPAELSGAMWSRRDFHFDLPKALIAQEPLVERRDSRLLVLDPGVSIKDSRIRDFPDFLQPEDLLVLNDTRVIPARLFGHKASGGRIECLIERLLDDRTALIHLRASKTPCVDSLLTMEGGYVLRVIGREADLFRVILETPGDLTDLVETHGHVPLPPYIERADADFDLERYQTVYARSPGAVAAPTAGLHFDEHLLEAISRKGIDRVTLTLHVGSGTFRPIRAESLEDHRMHSERYSIAPETVARILATQRSGGRVIAVGTTVVRALESAARDGVLRAFEGETDIFIRPGFPFQVVDALLTNFHLPESTLLALVSAFGGYNEVMAAYRHAVKARYRFFSYGDAMFLAHRKGPA